VETIRQREVDDPVIATEWHCGLGPVGSQWMKPRTHAAGQYNGKGFIKHSSPR
jgi:hypothetical protein